MLVRGSHGHFSSRAATCRGMPLCPCYLRVDLRPRPGLCCLCVGANTRTARKICPQSARAKTSAARASRARHPARRHRRAGPGRQRYPAATQRTADPSASDHTNAWEGPPCTRRDSSSRQHTGPPPPGGPRTLCLLPITLQATPIPLSHEPRLRTVKRNACSASQNHAERCSYVCQGDRLTFRWPFWGCGVGVPTGLLLVCGQDRDGPLQVERASSDRKQPPHGGQQPATPRRTGRGVAPHLGGIRWVLVTAPASDG